MIRFTGAMLLLASFACFLYGSVIIRERITPIHPKQTETPAPEMLMLAIPSIQVVLPVIPAHMVNGKWETTNSGISHATTSPEPGTPGNSILYGHNWPNLLGNLPQVRPGDRILVRRGGREFVYIVRYTATIDSTAAAVFNPSDDTRITLYTCTGFMDSKRFVVTAIKT